MAQVSVSQSLHAQNQTEMTTHSKSQGTLKTGSGEITVEFISESESISKGASAFLQEMNQLPEDLADILSQHSFTYFPQETIELELEIFECLEFLKEEAPKEEAGKPTQHLTHKNEPKTVISSSHNKAEGKPEKQPDAKASKETQVVYSSLFSLARSFNQNLNKAKNEPAHKQHENKSSDHKHNLQANLSITEKQTQIETRFEKQQQERDKNQDQQKGQDRDREGSGSFDDEKKRRQDQQQEDTRKVKGVAAARGAPGRQLKGSVGSNPPKSNGSATTGSIENIFIRFMALMARILGQAEAEAHDLYLRIKERTDSVDVLTLFISKINSEKGSIDWTKNEEMKKLVEQVRQIGVEIPQGKYKWSDEEKKLLKENVQMRKDSMEKITQLERTDMQRFLQEASQCHQARSNVLKLLKEVMDTIIANMRP